MVVEARDTNFFVTSAILRARLLNVPRTVID